MKTLGTIKESDIFPNNLPTPEEELGKLRQAVRIALFDKDKNIAMGYYPPSHHNEMKGTYDLPGGGVDDGETINEALLRECFEETGCNIKNIRELGIVKEFGVGKNVKHNQDSYCFMADVDGEKMIPKFTEREIQDGLEVHWITVEEALKHINSKKLCFDKIRELLCLEEVKNQAININRI